MNKHILYLASGSARRFGANKLLAELGGQPLYRYGLEVLARAASETENCTLTVVSSYEEIRRAAQAMGIRTSDSPRSAEGLSYTIRTAIGSIENLKEEDFLLFAAADQPYMETDSVKRLLACARPEVETARLYCGEIPGNPVLFSAKLVPELRALEGDQGGGKVAQRHSCVPVYVEDGRQFRDVDVPEDLPKKHAAITGARGAGKSTLARRWLKRAGIEAAGFRTVCIRRTEAGPIYAMEEIGSGERRAISEWEDGRIRGIPEAFETFGAKVVRRAIQSEAPILLLDEIGRFERESPSFLAALDEAFQSEKRVLAVLKKEELPHLRKIRSRTDLCLIDLDEVPRSGALEILLEKFPAQWRETANGRIEE